MGGVRGSAPPPSPSHFVPSGIPQKTGGVKGFFSPPATTGENGGFVAAEK